MIALEFKGQLGNQFFQYVAARTQAKRLNCGIVLQPNSYNEIYKKNYNKNIAYVIKNVKFSKISEKFHSLFALSNTVGSMTFNACFPTVFPSSDDDFNQVSYLPEVWSIRNRTRLSGYFLSSKYFDSDIDLIRTWLSPNDLIESLVEAQLKTLPAPQNEMVAVHVRLGDYLIQHGAHSDNKLGWSLTPEYYRKALANFPENSKIALFSDDTVMACSFLPRKPTWISKPSHSAVDLFLMAKFKNLIIANSTYSWWSAKLNKIPNKFIVGPKYFSGSRLGVWHPRDIAESDWHYV